MNEPESIGAIVERLMRSASVKSDEEIERMEKQRIQEVRIQLYAESELYEKYRSFRPQMSDSPVWTALYEKIKGDALKKKQFYTFLGTRGSGKSVLGACLVGHWCFNLGKRAIYTSAVDMINVFKMATHGFLSDYEHKIFKFLNANLLVVDCIENKFNDERSLAIFDELIDKRVHEHSSPNCTILISNHTERAFLDIVGKSAESRIKAYGGIYGDEFFGESRRNKF